MFMHNGFIGKWNRVRRHVEALIPDEMYPSRVGTTDSEAVFLAIIGALDRDPVAATAGVLTKLSPERSQKDDAVPDGSFLDVQQSTDALRSILTALLLSWGTANTLARFYIHTVRLERNAQWQRRKVDRQARPLRCVVPKVSAGMGHKN
jgi:predicted glutamine amidotransferase